AGNQAPVRAGPSAVRPADGNRAARSGRPQLRGDRVLARRRDRHGEIAAHTRAAGAASRPAGSKDGMRVFTCPETLENLEAFHDRELAVADEIGISAHLEWCAECGEAWNALRTVRAA